MQEVPPEDREYIGEPPACVRIMFAYEKEFNGSDTLRLVARYETRLQRAFEKADAGLRRLQKERRAWEESPGPEPESTAPNESNAPAEPRPSPIAKAHKIVEMPAPLPKPAPEPTPEAPASPFTPPPE
jgi:hypothetical protein